MHATRRSSQPHTAVSPSPARAPAAVNERCGRSALRRLLQAKAQALKRWEEAKGGQPERLVSGSDDFTLFLWNPAEAKAPLARMTGA